MGAAGHKAGAYISSWSTWAKEQRKGWGKSRENLSIKVNDSSAAGEKTGGPASRYEYDEESLSEQQSETLGNMEKEKERQRPKAMSPRKSKRGSKESIGGDGIGRLDA